MFGVLGFLPGWVCAKILNSFGMLRVPKEIELLGLDIKGDEAYQKAVDDVKAAEKASVERIEREHSMSTIKGLDSWAVDLADIGPVYPFQGTEVCDGRHRHAPVDRLACLADQG